MAANNSALTNSQTRKDFKAALNGFDVTVPSSRPAIAEFTRLIPGGHRTSTPAG
jgi:hypothetical protein